MGETPDTGWTKTQIQEYLTQNNVDWTSSDTKAQLLSRLD